MKVLFDHPSPFLLAHGGFQIQIEQTMSALRTLGVDAECLRWWDATQGGDVLHFFGRPSTVYVASAQRKKLKVVISELLTGTGSRTRVARLAQKCVMMVSEALLPKAFTDRLGWDGLRSADAVVALTQWEASLFANLFSVPQRRIACIGNGVEDVFFQKRAAAPGKWLVCTATIAVRKRVLELARAAVAARTPIWIIGKPYSTEDRYARQFMQFAAEYKDVVRYEGPIDDRTQLAEVYREAAGFVLLSTMESLSLSACEAAACGCPLLLSDLPWARSTFRSGAMFCPIAGMTRTAAVLRQFYDAAPTLPTPPKPPTWKQVGEELKALYLRLLSTSP